MNQPLERVATLLQRALAKMGSPDDLFKIVR
jgi:hypothetical protein